MKILISGASSTIGLSIIKEFAPNNQIFVITRNLNDRIYALKENAFSLGCKDFKIYSLDLGLDIDNNFDKIFENDYDIFINAASATSNLLDEKISTKKHKYYTNIDLTNPLIIANNILKNKIHNRIESRLSMIFINTLLTKISNKNHIIYSSYKNLQNEYLKSLQNTYPSNFNVLCAYVGTRINRKVETNKSKKIAKSIKIAFDDGAENIVYGYDGKLLLIAQKVHPLFPRLLISINKLFMDSN